MRIENFKADSPAFYRRKMGVLAKSVPFLSSLLFIIFMHIPTHIPELNDIVPMFGLAVLFFWSSHVPRLLPIWLVFILGLVEDMLGGGLLGVNALLYLFAREAIVVVRHFIKDAPFLIFWALFTPYIIIGGLFIWILVGVGDGFIFGEIEPLIVSLLLTILLYPLISLILTQIYRYFLKGRI